MDYQTRKVRIKQLYENPNHKWAVFARTKSGSRAVFSTLHDSQEKATEVARTHAASQASEGNFDVIYIVVEIKHTVGFDQGKPIDSTV